MSSTVICQTLRCFFFFCNQLLVDYLVSLNIKCFWWSCFSFVETLNLLFLYWPLVVCCKGLHGYVTCETNKKNSFHFEAVEIPLSWFTCMFCIGGPYCRITCMWSNVGLFFQITFLMVHITQNVWRKSLKMAMYLNIQNLARKPIPF